MCTPVWQASDDTLIQLSDKSHFQIVINAEDVRVM